MVIVWQVNKLEMNFDNVKSKLTKNPIFLIIGLIVLVVAIWQYQKNKSGFSNVNLEVGESVGDFSGYSAEDVAGINENINEMVDYYTSSLEMTNTALQDLNESFLDYQEEQKTIVPESSVTTKNITDLTNAIKSLVTKTPVKNTTPAKKTEPKRSITPVYYVVPTKYTGSDATAMSSTLSGIAIKYNTTVSKIMSLNNMKSTVIGVGQRIRVK